MTKYVIAVLIFVAALAGVLLYIGETSQLLITSMSDRASLNFESRISWRFAIVALTVITITLFVLWAFLGWLVRLPGQLKSGVGLRRRTQALEAMEEALIAGSEGDANRARKKSEKARALISSPALGRMVSAQAAEACGDREEAISHYSAMLDDEKTLATGQRGLAQQMLAKGDVSGAIEHAGKAYADNKNARWAFDVLFQAQVSDYRWAEAIATLDTAISRKHIEKSEATRRRAVLQTALADDLNNSGNATEALVTALSATKDVPDFAPAVSLAANLLTKDGQSKKAISLIEKAWSTVPHPALSLAYRDVYASEEPKTISKKLRGLVKQNPDHRESKILLVEDSLARDENVAAMVALSPLIEGDNVSSRICLLAYATEAKLGNSKDAQVWLQRAATAPAEPDWSDLDPQGDAFDYKSQDWRRLVFSYGESGTLIHPRFETGAMRRQVIEAATLPVAVANAVVTPDSASDTPVPVIEEVTTVIDDTPEISVLGTEKPVEPIRQPDDPGIVPSAKSVKDDLAERLDSLLDDGSQKK